MKGEIISVGTELLLGEVVDTNSNYLALQLPLVGIDLRWISTVGDSLDGLIEVFHRAIGRSDIIIATGGLGPTGDDLTREAIAAVLGETPSVNEALLEGLRAFFLRFGRTMSPHNIKQATLIPSAEAIVNPRGTAPGWWVEKGMSTIVAIPGPPGEMQRMWEIEVAPRLQKKIFGHFKICRTLKCFGRGEAETDELIASMYLLKNPDLGIYAKPDGIHLRLVAMAGKEIEAREMLDSAEVRLRDILGDSVWGSDSETLETVTGELLARLGLKLATMESVTGGLLASTVTDVSGSSGYFQGGLISYTSESKSLFGVEAGLIEKHGAVSHETAQAMADVARCRFNADIGLATTGVAGPDPMEGKPPGLVYIAISDHRGTRSVEAHYPPRRPDVKRLAVIHALFLLRQVLLELEPEGGHQWGLSSA